MGQGCKPGVFAIISALALAAATTAPANAKPHHHYQQAKGIHGYIRSLGYGGIDGARRARWALHGRKLGYVNLAGDPESGFGFYALPLKYRIGAWRYSQTHWRPWWHNPILFAIAADAARYDYWIPANHDYAYGVFSPYDGVGTPFFGGYYR